MKKFLLYFILSMCSAVMHAELDFTRNVSQPQTPTWETFEIMKYGKVGTSLYTGTINYSIPLYSYTDQEIQIQLALSYATNGLVVNHNSGMLGHGWSLTGLGMVTREIKGIPDESVLEAGYDLVESSYSASSYYGYKYANGFLDEAKIAYGNGDGVYYVGRYDANRRLCETTPDIYSFNFCGYSGSFERDIYGGFKMFNLQGPSNGIKIEEFDETGDIELIDSNGTKYYFTKQEYTVYDANNQYAGLSKIVMCWHLTEIEELNGLITTFHYYQDNIETIDYSYRPVMSARSVNTDLATGTSSISENVVVGKTNKPRLTRIDLPDQTRITFNYREINREKRLLYVTKNEISDAEGNCSRLVSIDISHGEKIIKSLTLEYEGKTAKSNDNIFTFLNKLEITGEGSYEFEYNKMYGYPALGTVQYDHWGYYNKNGETLNSLARNLSYDSSFDETLNSTQKDPNFEASLSGTLSKIKYPTGGISEIYYEPHTYSQAMERKSSSMFGPVVNDMQTNNEAGGVRVKKIVTYLKEGEKNDSTEYIYTRENDAKFSSGILLNSARYGIKYMAIGVHGRKNVSFYDLSNSMYDYNRTHIEYAHVKEVKSGSGSKDYYYGTAVEYPDIMDNLDLSALICYINTDDSGNSALYTEPYLVHNALISTQSNQYRRGHLEKEEWYDDCGIKLRDVRYKYNHIEACSDTIVQLVGEQSYGYKNIRYNIELEEKLTSDYVDGKPITKKEIYKYNRIGLPIEIGRTMSDEGTLVTSYKYASDIDAQTDVEKAMKRYNNISLLLSRQEQKITGEDTILLSKEKAEYYFPDKEANYVISPHYIIEQGADDKWRVTSTLDYDCWGYPAGVTNPNDISEAYLWCNMGQSLVSVVKNATISVVNETLHNEKDIDGYDLFEQLMVHDDSNATALKGLNNNLENAQVNVYQRDEFGNITEIDCPNGTNTTYQYDEYGRLIGDRNEYGQTTHQYYYNIISAKGNSSDANYISVRTFSNSSGSNYLDTYHYYDYLGRKEIEVQRGITPGNQNLVTSIVYDELSRRHKEYLPFVSNIDCETLTAEERSKLAISCYGDKTPYTEIDYERSMLDRVASATGAGWNWHSQGKSKRIERLINKSDVDSLSCYMLTASNTRIESDTTITITNKGLYPSYRLYVTRQEDEDGHVVMTFTDKQGKTLLERSILRETGHNVFADTYYVYDIYDKLVAAVQPNGSKELKEKASWSSSDVYLKNYAFMYLYDYQGRCRGKKLPGCSWQLYVLDKGGREIFSQDGNQRKSGFWKFVLYDNFDRPCVTGLCENSFDVLKQRVPEFTLAVKRNNKTGIYKGYEVDSLTIKLESPIVLKADYYDDYTFMGSNGIPASTDENVAYEEKSGYGVKYAVSAKGMQTGSLTAVLDYSAFAKPIDYLYAINYYDAEGQIVQRKSKNNLGGFDAEYNSYNFLGAVEKERKIHSRKKAIADSIEVVSDDEYTYSYDHANRLLQVNLRHNNGAMRLLVINGYNQLCQLIEKYEGDYSTYNTYKYNVRGWITSLTDNATFAQDIRYDSPQNGGEACYNGNVSEISWGKTSAKPRKYKFKYDSLNRLTSANYSEENSQKKFGEVCTYDLNGCVTSILRQGMTEYSEDAPDATKYGTIDDLKLEYRGNNLVKVTDYADATTYYGASDFVDGADEEDEYTWDENGNLTSDANKGIVNIEYNVLNLPRKVKYSSTKWVEYDYDANGAKLAARYYVPTLTAVTTVKLSEIDKNELPDIRPPIVRPRSLLKLNRQYSGSHIYENGVIAREFVPDGYLCNDTLYVYIYDYQGNVRSVVDEYGKVKETNSYYPYGSIIVDCDEMSTSVQPYKYGCKEYDVMNGLNLYDFHARQYDPVLCQFLGADKKSEIDKGIATHVYCIDNPIRYIDPDGQYVETAWDVFNISLDITSLVSNIRNGKTKDAIVDIGATIFDVAAAALPGVPGGVGSALKASRAAQAATSVGKGKKVVQAATKIIKANKNNYRKLLQKATGKQGVGCQAHHTFPQKFRPHFEKLGINIDEPGNVVWRETKSHQKKSRQHIDAWEREMRHKPKTKKEALEMRDKIEMKIWGNKGDIPKR